MKLNEKNTTRGPSKTHKDKTINENDNKDKTKCHEHEKLQNLEVYTTGNKYNYLPQKKLKHLQPYFLLYKYVYI